MTKVLIVFHSQTGNTEKLARAVAQGVSNSEGSHAVLKSAFDTTASDMKESDAIIFCSPEYFGYMAGAVKDLFDRTFEELQDAGKMLKKPCAVVISAGNDGTSALKQIERIAKGFRLKMVQNPILSQGRVSEEIIKRCYELGRTIAEGVNANVF